MKVDWQAIGQGCSKFIEFAGYFFITIVLLSSIGVWMPFAIDLAQSDKIQEKTWIDLPWNLITYSIAIVVVAFIDRLLHLVKVTNKYTKNTIEFIFFLFLMIIGGLLVFQSLVHGKFNRPTQSTFFACCFAAMSWIVWIYVKARSPKEGNYSSLGGNFN